MKRSFVQRSHVKERYPDFFRALASDAKGYPGGLPALADQLGRNYGSLKNALNPTNYDSEPTVELLIELIEATTATRALPALARRGGQTVLPAPAADEATCEEVVRHFMQHVGIAATFKARMVEAAANGDLCDRERDDLADKLDAHLMSCVMLRALLRGR